MAIDTAPPPTPSPTAARETPTDPDAPDRTAHETALDRFRLCTEAYQEQRARELADLRFVDVAGAQWDDDIRKARLGVAAGGGLPAVAPRPCLEFNLLRAPVQQVINTARAAKLGLSFAPDGEGATQALAQAYDDIARAVQADSRAHLARQWAFERAAKCGFGAYRLLTEYTNARTFDQKIVYKRILNQASVYLDPFAQEPDWSDGQFALLTEDLPLARYKRAHPGSELASYSDRELTALGNDIPQWITTTHGDAGVGVRVAEYWEVRETTDLLVLLPDGTTAREGDIPPGLLADVERDRGTRLPRRPIVTARKVFWSLINGVETLEGPQEWNGRYIPIVPVVGDEANVNGDRRWSGIVQFARDAQQSYNYMRSAQVEAVGLAPRAPWLIGDGQLEGYEAWWQQANTRNLPYLPFRLTTYSGGPAAPPSRNVAEPAIQAVTIAAAAAKDDLHATTNLPPVALGQLDPSDRSGVAIRALQGQAEVGTSGYLDNLSSISMLYEGKILKDLIPRIYDRPGRVVPALGVDDRRRSLLVNIPFVRQPDGQPQAVPPGTPGAETVDLRAGDQLSVQAVVGKSYATRREETAEAIAGIMQAAPALAPILAPFWLDELDFPGAKKLAAIAKKTLPPQFQDEEGQPGPSVPQLQQQLGQAQQMIQLLTKELQAKTEVIQTDQVKQQGEVQIKQAEYARDVELQRMKDATAIAVAEINAATKGATSQLTALHEAIALAREQRFEAEQRLADRVHEGVQRAHDRTHDVVLAAHEADQAQRDREHEMAMAAQQQPATSETESA
jgi:hypothetical protein